jgi:hypothetical protein
MTARKVWWDGAWVDLSGGGGGGPAPLLIGRLQFSGASAGFTANRAYQSLHETPANIVVNRVGCRVSTQAGNIDLGVYAPDGTGSPLGVASTRLASTGSTACPAAGYREFTIPDTTIVAGWFWIALATDSTSTGFAYTTAADVILPVSGAAPGTGIYHTASSFPLPSTMGSPTTSTNMPCVWVRYVP